jgi:hypothetical protein
MIFNPGALERVSLKEVSGNGKLYRENKFIKFLLIMLIREVRCDATHLIPYIL